MVSKLKRKSLRPQGKSGRHNQCAWKESGNRVSRPQCPSVCHQFTFSLGHMWNDHLNSSVVYKTCVNSSRKMSTVSGCEPVSPSRIRLPMKAFPARHCQKLSISLTILVNAIKVNISLVASVPLTLHTDEQLPWYGKSLQTSVPCVIVASPFDALVMALTYSYPMRLMSCSILAFGIGFVIKSARFTLVSTFFVANRPDLEASCIQRFCMSTCFAQSPAIDQAHRSRGIQVHIQFAGYSKSLATLWTPSPSEASI